MLRGDGTLNLVPVGFGDRTSRTGEVRTHDRGDRVDVSDAEV